MQLALLESLESRQLLSGKNLVITGAATSTDVLEVNIEKKGVYATVNGNGEFYSYSRKLKQISIKAGVTLGNNTAGEHTVIVNVRANRARIHIYGSDKSVNHLNVNIFAKNVPVTLHGGNQSLNELKVTTHAKNGAATIIGGNFSTNLITFGGGTNTIYGGHNSRNAYFQTVVKSQGYVKGGNESSNIFYSPNGTYPHKYKLRNGVSVEQA